MKGTVKFFAEDKGFGFINGEDGKEYFAHVTGLSEGVRLNENDAVEFDVEQGDRGPKAVNIKLASADSASEESPVEEASEEATEEAPAEEASEEASEETSEEATEETAEESEKKEE